MESQTALVQRISALLRSKFALARAGGYEHDEIANR